MLPDNRLSLESSARRARRRLVGDTSTRAGRLGPRDWPRNRGPTPNPWRR